MKAPFSKALRRGLVAVCAAASLAGTAVAGPYAGLAEELARHVASGVALGVGAFLYEDTESSTPFSSLLRQELETELSRRGLRIVARERLGELELEGRFQQQGLLTPGTAVEAVRLDGVQAIVRGRFYYQFPSVRIFAEVVRLEGGEVRKASASIPAEEAGASVWPLQEEASVAAYLRPQNLESSQTNIREAREMIREVPRDFRTSIVTTSGRTDYRQGETIAFKVQAERDCHVAVVCHQADGTSVLLFPNAHNRDTFIPGGRVVEIPGTAKAGFEIFISPPFGSDVVQVIASTHKSALHQMAAEIAEESARSGELFRGTTRGMFSAGIQQGLKYTGDPAHAPLWGWDSMVVSTAP
jgi:hypothetical protein